MIDVLQPLEPRVAKDLARRAIEAGNVAFTSHALRELKKDNLTTLDAENVIKGGVVDHPEWENGEWRYRFWTARIALIVTFETETDIVVVTGWRLR